MVNATGHAQRRRAGRRRDDRRRARARARRCSASTSRPTSTRSSTRPASTSSPAASTRTPTWSCRSAAPTPRDTFETGTRAAAWGGTTTIIDFAVQRYGERVEDGLAAWHAKAAGNCAIDYGFHQIIGGVDEFSLKAMDDSDRRGHHQLQAVHGLPGRLLLRRRADPQGDAEVAPRPGC